MNQMRSKRRASATHDKNSGQCSSSAFIPVAMTNGDLEEISLGPTSLNNGDLSSSKQQRSSILESSDNFCASSYVENIHMPDQQQITKRIFVHQLEFQILIFLSPPSGKRRFSTDVHNLNGTKCPKPKQLRLHQESATQLCLSLQEEKRREAMLAMEKDFDSKLKIQGNSSSNGGGSVQRSKSFAFRAPQENYSIHDFELGRIYGVGYYSKVCLFLSTAQ
ncbi:hypothetical protein RIF29_06844 [Crotalaria pallida]|uniref:Uncharacterized protein n=1 Tax=Crotalaria pallida TaxID=3830 RepID=A0AAN9J563_CROPI